jgi:signal transduction histidine kinase
MVEKWGDSDGIEEGAAAAVSAEARRPELSTNSSIVQNAMLASATLSVMATDANGIIQLFNVGAERMFGYGAVEVINRITPVDIHDPQALRVRAQAVSRELSTPIAPNFEALACKARLGIEDCYESTLIRKNRERLPVVISITALRDDLGAVIGYSLIVHDIAVRRQVGFEPYEAPAAAQGADYCQSNLLTRMSHEMRTPLSAILGFAQLMEADRPSPTVSQKRSLARILEAGWYLEKVINMTRDLALIESGTLSLTLEAVPLAAVMLDCQALIEPQAQARGVRVTFPLFETACSVSADRHRLQEVFDHVLSAAINDSVVDGSIVVNCETHGSEWIRIGINDGGASPERLARNLRSADGFAREEAAADDVGIGLLLAKRLLALMGGVLGAQGNDRTNRAFYFDLRRMLVPMAAGQSPSHSAFAEAAMPGRRPPANHGSLAR